MLRDGDIIPQPKMIMLSKNHNISAGCNASSFEEPCAVIPQTGVREGDSGNWPIYLDYCRLQGSGLNIKDYFS